MRRAPFIVITLVYILGLVVCYQAHLFGFGPTQVPQDTLIYQARLTDIPQEKPKTYKCIAQLLQSSPTNIIVYLHKDSTQHLQIGDTVVFQARLRYLRNYNMVTAYAPPYHWRIQGHARRYTLQEQALLCRERILERLRPLIRDSLSFGLLSSLTLGDRVYLDPDLKQHYVNAGAMHVLAVSGLHVGIIYSLLMLLTCFMGNLPQARVARTTIVLAAVWVYAFLTGLSPSVQRASIMLTVGQLGWMTYRHQNFYNTVSIAALICLLIDPRALFGPSFQLSFAAVISLVAFSNLLKPIPKKSYILNHTLSILFASLAVQLGTFPISIYYFHQFSTYFWLSSLLVIPLAYLIMVFTIFTLLLPLGTGLSSICRQCLNWSLHTMNRSVTWVDSLPHSVIPIQIDLYQTLLLLLIVILFYRLLSIYIHRSARVLPP